MELVKVKSSNLDAVGYDESSSTLRILFHTGVAYDYSGVPQELYNQLMEASSKGSFFQEHVVGKFKYTKVNLEKERTSNGTEQTAEASSRAR